MITLLLSLLADAAPEVHRLSKDLTTVYAIVGDSGVVLVDAHYPGEADWIEAELADVGIALSEVTLAVITHAHSDHAGSAAALQAAGIPVALGAGDVAQATAGQHDEPTPTDWRGALIKPTVKPDYPAFSPDVVVEDALDLAAYGVAGRVEVVGGHSPGSVVVSLPDGRVFVGDLIRGRMIRRATPTLHFFHTDTDLSHATLAELLDAGATGILPGHGKPMSPEKVRRWLDRQ